MKRLLTACLILPTALAAVSASANPGMPDLTFGSNGLFRLPPRAGYGDSAEHITSAPGGKIFLTGSTNNGRPGDDTAYREGDSVAALRADGQLDTGFAGLGYRRSEYSQIVHTGGQYVFAPDNGQLIQVQRRRLICGVGAAPACGGSPNSSPFISVLRFNANGAEDPTYGNAGSATLPGVANAVFASSQGELTIFQTNENSHSVIRLTANGLLSADGFSENATNALTRCSNALPPTRLTGAARLSDGRFVVAMNRTESGMQLLCLIRIGQDGRLDMTFGQAGAQMVTMGESFRFADVRFLLERPDGGLLAIHQMNGVTPNDPRCEELLWFSSTGQPETRPAHDPARVCRINTAAFQSDGKLLVAGNMTTVLTSTRMSRLNADGSVDMTFGISGMAPVQFGDVHIQPRHLHVDAAGKILLIGHAESTNPDSNTGGRIAVARFLSAAQVVPPTPIDPDGMGGGGGGGCGSIHRGPVDPTLPTLLLLAIMAAAYSRRRHHRSARAIPTATSA